MSLEDEVQLIRERIETAQSKAEIADLVNSAAQLLDIMNPGADYHVWFKNSYILRMKAESGIEERHSLLMSDLLTEAARRQFGIEDNFVNAKGSDNEKKCDSIAVFTDKHSGVSTNNLEIDLAFSDGHTTQFLIDSIQGTSPATLADDFERLVEELRNIS